MKEIQGLASHAHYEVNIYATRKSITPFPSFPSVLSCKRLVGWHNVFVVSDVAAGS